MRFSCWITKATDTNSEYVSLIAFPLQQWLQERACMLRYTYSSGVPRNFFRGGSTNSVEDRGQREWESGGGSPLVRGSGGSCNLVQEISFHIVKFS